MGYLTNSECLWREREVILGKKLEIINLFYLVFWELLFGYAFSYVLVSGIYKLMVGSKIFCTSGEMRVKQVKSL